MREFDFAFRAKVSPRLAALGFEGTGLNHVRRDGDRTQVIRVQQHERNTALASVRLMLMTASFEQMTVKDGLAWGGDRASPGDMAFADRKGRHVIALGWLTPARTDLWYEYQSENSASVNAAVSRMLEDLETYGLPWLAAPMRNGPRRWTAWDLIGWILWSRVPPLKSG